MKTAPQILEHYLGYCLEDIGMLEDDILKAMRHYARVKGEKSINVCLEDIKSRLREEVKDEMYEEARENILIQYNLKNTEKEQLNWAGTFYGRNMYIDGTPEEAKKLTDYMSSQHQEMLSARISLTEREIDKMFPKKKSIFSRLF